MSVSPIKNKNGEIIGASNIMRDITIQKEYERQKDSFIATASHELKTPLTSLKGFTQVLEIFSKRKNDETSLRLVEKMNKQLKKLTNLIADLLDVTKIQSGQLSLNLAFFDFDEMLREIVESMQLTTEDHALILQGNVGKDVYGDRERTEQIIINFLTNAIKYSPGAKDVFIYVKLKKKKVEVAVQDFGIGIPKEKQKNVFDQFFRVNGSASETYPGLGLGLFISNEIARRLRGKIWVKSEEGKGSIFYLELPIQKRKITQI